MILFERIAGRFLGPEDRWPPPWLGPRGRETRVLLHIGMHKTGTTTIQSALRSHRMALARLGILYPRLGAVDVHHGLARAWVRILSEDYDLAGGPEAAWERLAEHYAGSRRLVVLSSEEFSRLGGVAPVDPAGLRARAAAIGRVEVLCVLRGQIAFAQSVYAQISRRRRPEPPQAIVRNLLTTGLVHRPSTDGGGLFADYGALYDRLLSGFAPEELHFLSFEAAAAGPGSVTGAFFRALGLDGRRALRFGVPAENVSPPALAVWAAAELAGPGRGPVPPALVAAAAAALSAEFGTARSSIFTREEAARLAAHFNPLNRALAARIGRLQPGFALPELGPEPGAVHREDLTPAFWARLRAAAAAGGEDGAAGG